MQTRSEGRFRIVAVENRSDWQPALEQALTLSADHPVLLDVEELDMEMGQITSFVNLFVDVAGRNGVLVLVNPTDDTLRTMKNLELPDSFVFASANMAMMALGGGLR
jgi:hypothetical protein